MSRIGKKPVEIPAGVEVKLDGAKVIVKGAKGTLEHTVVGEIKVAIEGNEVIVTRPNDEKENRSLHGMTRTMIANMVEGVTGTAHQVVLHPRFAPGKVDLGIGAGLF